MLTDVIPPEKASALARGLQIVELSSLKVKPHAGTPKRKKGPRTSGDDRPANRRHSNRTHCVYCGVTMVHSKRGDDQRTWDHVVPHSVGGRLQLPSCSWCNGKKAGQSVTDWLASSSLALRKSMVEGRDAGADPMQERLILQIRDEDLLRIRRDIEYHSR